MGINEVGASAEDTAIEMQELLEDINNTQINEKNILKAAAFLHCKMENIHPFADGNGRTGRLLVNYFLMINNHPPMIIFNEDKKMYFTALRQWDSEQKMLNCNSKCNTLLDSSNFLLKYLVRCFVF